MKKSIIIVLLAICGLTSNIFAQNKPLEINTKKMAHLMWLINTYYVDTSNISKLSEKGIEAMLKELDPHSVYIPTKEVQNMNAPLQGNIIGIGVTFQLLNDTIHIMDVVAEGPAEKVGIYPGDRIIRVNDTVATGDSINNEWVISRLRGKKNTVVKVDIDRKGKGIISFDIKRDNIPLNSIDTWFMIDKEIGYVSLRRFSQNSDEELINAINDLKKQGMKKLIFDLRSNGGGYLESAFKICEEFLPENKMVVYTQGEKQPRQEWKTSKRKGVFEKGNMVILTDEYSASASEITSGAMQDWDRAVIMGRRTFGKGLVQRPFNLEEDGSQVRLTVARYYIPSGRCIQKPYENGADDYRLDYQKRYSHGEMVYADSISFADSLKYYTNNNRVVYGGGGIMPDIFVPMDTTRASDYYINLRSKNLFNEFSINWTETHREEFLKKCPTFEDFNKAWESLNLLKEFQDYAFSHGVKPTEIKTEWVDNMLKNYLQDLKKDSTKTYTSYTDYANNIFDDSMLKTILEQAKQEDEKQQELVKGSNIYIESNLKGFIARNLYGTKYYYKSVSQNDETLQRAVELLKNDKQYNEILKERKK